MQRQSFDDFARVLCSCFHGGHSRGVFTGRIIVRPGAQKTDSKQTNNNLLLSTDAHADSQPQLEIYADDVKCTHGSTVGPLDPRALFYLRSRGIDQDQARRLMTYGFAAEILGRMEVAPLRAQLDRIVAARQFMARAAQVASEQLVEKTKGLEETQQESIDQLQLVQDQLQTVRRLLAAQQAESKRLSDEVTALNEAVDGLRQSFASSQADPSPAVARNRSIRMRAQAVRLHQKRIKSHG